MTILPKKKTHLPNTKPDRYGNARAQVSGNADHQHSHSFHHRYGGVSPSAHAVSSNSNIDVTSGAMSTSGILHLSSSAAAVGGALAQVASAAAVGAKRAHYNRKHTASISAPSSLSLSSSALSGSSASSESVAVASNSSIIVGTGHGVEKDYIERTNKRKLEKTSLVSAKQRNHKAGPSSSKQAKQAAAKNAEACNSDDEYGLGFRDDELEVRFVERLKKARGLIIKNVQGDGACMFRAVADQVYGDEEMHTDVRTLCMDYIAKNRDHFSQFLTEDFDEYLARKRETDAHGNHVELQAISEIFSRPVEIYEYSIDPINTFHPISPEANTGVENPPLRLSYHGTVHYNSVIDPYRATIGVGLGLPEFKPGMADKNLIKEAQIASEAQHIEEAMLNDKLRMTDWERTEEELSKKIAKESYMEYLRQMERGGNKKGEGSACMVDRSNVPSTSSSTLCEQQKEDEDSNKKEDIKLVEKNKGEVERLSKSAEKTEMGISASSSEQPIAATDATTNLNASESHSGGGGLYEELLAASALVSDDWPSSSAILDETAEIARVLALSQQEFYESMTRRQ